MDTLVGQGETLRADAILQLQAVGQGVDRAGPAAALVARAIEVAIQAERGTLQVHVEIDLAPDVVQLRGEQRAAQVVACRQAGAGEADGAAGGARAVAVEVAVAGAGGLFLEGGEAPGLDPHAVEVVALQEEAPGVLGLQALVAGIEDRGLDGHLADLEQALAEPQLECGAGVGILAGVIAG